MQNSTSIGLQRIPLKDLLPDLDNILIVGLIIGKQSPRKFPDRSKENDQYRAVWNFTLRDSPRDYINVTYWGPSEDVCASNDKFYIGDIVEIRNPRINIRKFNETGEQYVPMVTSPYSLTLSDHSQILPYQGDIFPFSRLLNFPTKPLSGYVSLRDIQNGSNMKDRSLDILGAVRHVGTVKHVNKNGQELQVRDFVLFDHTGTSLKVNIWDVDMIARASNWKLRTTILFITDAKVVWNSFARSYTASITGRSIVTENPIGQEAVILANYAKSAPLDSIQILDQFMTELPDPETIQNVMCVQQISNKIQNLQDNTTDTQFTALLYVVVTQLNLDGQISATRLRCHSCRGLLRRESPVCVNTDCAVVTGNADKVVDYNFDVPVNLSDHTGTLTRCRLTGNIAEHILGCSVEQFMKMSNEQKSKLKWKYLLERCAVRILVLKSSRFRPRVSIISCSRTNPIEAAQRIALC